MNTFNHYNKELLNSYISDKVFRDSCILNSDLDFLEQKDTEWTNIDISNTNCNSSIFANVDMSKCSFFRSSLINSFFKNCRIKTAKFSGVSLIKLRILNSRVDNQTIENCTLQRAQLNNTIFNNCLFKDIEAVYSKSESVSFINCSFSISETSGMNGFSCSELSDIIFYNCHFQGFPLRGALLKNCSFINCNGEITDDCESYNTNGIVRFANPNYLAIKNKKESCEFLKEALNE